MKDNGHPSLGGRVKLGLERERTASGLPIVLATAILSGTIISSCEQNWASLAQRSIFQPFGITKRMSQAEGPWMEKWGEK